MGAPKVGQYLYASCSAEDYGRVLAVGTDDNGVPTIDIEMFHPNDLVDCEDSEEAGPDNFQHPLTFIELPPDVRPILRQLQYRMYNDHIIICNTPGNGCYRCTKMFSLQDESFEERCRAN